MKLNRCLPLICFTVMLSFPLNAAENVLSPAPVSGRQITLEETIPADVLARVNLVRKEVNLIRLEIGKSAQQYPPFKVKNAAPREVFFQALTLFRKANRLSFEFTGTQTIEPSVPDREIHPYDVWNTTDAALKRLLMVKQMLNIPETVIEEAEDDAATPTDVYLAIVQANRQVNQILATKISPSDVFQQLTLAIYYTASLLGRYDVDKRIPQAPDFVRKKRPTDVYQRLYLCFQLLEKIANKSGLKILTLDESSYAARRKTPSDVYDLAALLLSELDYLHRQMPNAKTVRKSYFPGFKITSDVYQRASLLEKQLSQLHEQVTIAPTRLVLK